MPTEVYQFMVDFSMPALLTERFTRKIPEQRALVNEYFNEGKLVSYAVSIEKGRVWAVFNAESETEVNEMVQSLPLTRYMRYSIATLTFYNILAMRMPQFSIN
jgi:muconolactone delta-isomerase